MKYITNNTADEKKYKRYDFVKAVVINRGPRGLYMLIDNEQPAVCYNHHTRLEANTVVYATIIKDNGIIPVVEIDSVPEYAA